MQPPVQLVGKPAPAAAARGAEAGAARVFVEVHEMRKTDEERRAIREAVKEQRRRHTMEILDLSEPASSE